MFADVLLVAVLAAAVAVIAYTANLHCATKGPKQNPFLGRYR
jgi:hypothetical protein